MADLRVNIASDPPLNIKLQAQPTQSITLMGGTVTPGTKNYENLTNLPQINGETLIGDKTSADLHIVSENTESGWEEMGDYIPKNGEICLYTDTNQIKIGNGASPIMDLAYINGEYLADLNQRLRAHVTNYNIHVDEDEREAWNNKLNCAISGEILIFNRN